MPMDLSVQAVIIGATLAAVFAALGYLVRSSKDRRRILNVALFHLLEIWHQLRILSEWQPSQFADAYIEELKRQLPSAELKVLDQQQAKSALVVPLRRLFPPMVADRKASIEESFVESVKNLSQVDPVLAFRLGGNRSVRSAITVVDGYLKQVEVAAAGSADPEELEEIQTMLDDALRYAYKDAVQDLEKELIWLSFRAGFILTWPRTIYCIWRRRRRGTERLEKEMRTFVSEVVRPHFTSSKNAPAADGPPTPPPASSP